MSKTKEWYMEKYWQEENANTDQMIIDNIFTY